MTDEDLVHKKLAFIDTCLQELRALAQPALIPSDVKERRFIEHTLQICIQAAQDIALHIVSDQKLGEPRTNVELFSLLADGGWIDEQLAAALRSAVGFRNVVVHGYTQVDPAIVTDVVENHLDDLEEFARRIRTELAQRRP